MGSRHEGPSGGHSGAVRFGIRAKLFLAFGAVTATTVVASGVGLLSYTTVGDRLTGITSVNVPAISAASNLAEQSASVMAAAPLLDGAQDQEARRRLSGLLAAQLGRLSERIDELERQRGAEAVLELRRRAESMGGALRSLDQAVQRRLDLRAAREAALPELAAAHEAFLGALQPKVENASGNLVIQGNTLASFTGQSVSALTDEASVNLIALFEIRADITAAAAALTRVPRISTAEELARAREGFEQVAGRVEAALPILESRPDAEHAGELVGRLLDQGRGAGNVFDARAAELRGAAGQAAGSQRIAGAAAETEAQLHALIQPVVEAARGRIVTAGENLKYDTESAIQELLTNGLTQFRAYLELAAAGNLVAGLLNEAANTPDAARLPVLEERFEQALKRMGDQMSMLDDAQNAEIKRFGERLLSFGRGEASLFATRETELAALAEGAGVLDTARRLSGELATAVEGMVAEVKADTERSSREAISALESGRVWLVAIAVASIVGAGLIVWLYVGRVIVARLQRLSAAMRRVAEGDLGADIPLGGRDEISGMASALTVFRENAREVQAANRRAEEERVRAAEERRRAMLGLADEFEASVKAVVERVSTSASDVHRTADSMAATAGQTSLEATSAVAASEQATSSVESAAVAAEQLSSSISEISRRVNESARIARSAAGDAERTNETVRSLSEAAQKIGEVVELISSIAGQTNLLALNATIEAARAGEAGKGFAVVASEVKNLAMQTADATDEISTQIGAMQAATRDAVGAIQGIGRTIGTINEIATGIAAAVEEQGAATVEIVRSVQHAAEGTGQASANMAEVNRAASETGESAAVVLRAAADMSAQADTLREQVDRFLGQVRSA
jgi:methyl-accepting chemotaxis protein